MNKIRKAEHNHYQEVEKNGINKREQRTLQEQEEREIKAAKIVQTWCRIMLAKKKRRELQAKKNQKRLEREKEEEYTPVVSSNKESPVVSSRKLNIEDENPSSKVIKRKSKKATFIAKEETYEKPIQGDVPIEATLEEGQSENKREKLKKATTKPQFGKKKITSKPF